MFGLGKKKQKFVLKAPLSGITVMTDDIPDKAFSQKMLGDGGAIDPTDFTLLAPCDATVEVLFPTGHAVALKTAEGVEILLHIGIDTVDLKGNGFEKLVNIGDFVKEGTPLIRFNSEKIKEAGKPIVTPVMITNTDMVKNMRLNVNTQKAGVTDFIEYELA